MNRCAYPPAFDPALNRQPVNRWIISELAGAARETTAALESFRFNDAAQACYQFLWSTYCDWYVEFIKPVLAGEDADAAAETRATALWVLHQALHLLHPVMPFVTEELWEKTGPDAGEMLIAARWPEYPTTLDDAAAASELGWVVRLVSAVRAVRAEMNVPAGARVSLLIKGASAESLRRLSRYRDHIAALARLGTIAETGEIPAGAVQIVLEEAVLVLPLADVIDLAQERSRLEKELNRIEGEISRLDAKLGNESFVARAPAEVVDEQRERREEAAAARGKLAEALARVSAS
jgi:valyl-tRNA synthetase